MFMESLNHENEVKVIWHVSDWKVYIIRYLWTKDVVSNYYTFRVIEDFIYICKSLRRHRHCRKVIPMSRLPRQARQKMELPDTLCDLGLIVECYTVTFRWSPYWLFVWWVLTSLSSPYWVISWQSILLAGETGVPWGNRRPAVSNWQTWSHMAWKSNLNFATAQPKL